MAAENVARMHMKSLKEAEQKKRNFRWKIEMVENSINYLNDYCKKPGWNTKNQNLILI